jgi:hypothetical protein
MRGKQKVAFSSPPEPVPLTQQRPKTIFKELAKPVAGFVEFFPRTK